MESKQHILNNKETLLKKIGSWYMENADSKSYEYRFDIKHDVSWLKYKMITSVERILESCLTNDQEVDAKTMEYFKKLIK